MTLHIKSGIEQAFRLTDMIPKVTLDNMGYIIKHKKEVLKVVLQARQESGLTPKELAEATGINRGNISNLFMIL